MVSQPPPCLDQGISDMHTGVENHRDRISPGRPAEVPAEGVPGPCAALPGGRQGRRACPLARERGLTRLLPSASEGKNLEIEEQSFDGGKRKAENFI